MTNRERAERWVADRSTKGFYSPTTTDSLTALLDEVERDSKRAGAAEVHDEALRSLRPSK